MTIASNTKSDKKLSAGTQAELTLLEDIGLLQEAALHTEMVIKHVVQQAPVHEE